MALHSPSDKPAGDVVPHTGLWGTVSVVGTTTVEVVLPEFDGGEHSFGPVMFQPQSATPVEGDTAFLHFDSQHRPAYAVIFA